MNDWIDREVKKRSRIKECYPQLFQQVSAILFEHDPMGINYEDNTNEYEPEAGTIIGRLKDCSGHIESRKMIHEEFLRWFYDDVGDENEYTEIAKEIWEAWIAFGNNERQTD